MITNQNLQEVDLWETWIEFDQFNPNFFGTLYVAGEILITTGSKQAWIKKQKINGKELILQIPPRPIGRSRIKEVLYSEPLKNLSSYKSISIYSGQELIVRINDIEVLI